jgi:hypothetical protein
MINVPILTYTDIAERHFGGIFILGVPALSNLVATSATIQSA